MKCIICDRCGKVIKKASKAKIITCARPLVSPDSCICENARPVKTVPKKPLRETVWEKELCEACLDELEDFIYPEEPVEPKPDVPDPTDPTDPKDPTDPADPTDPTDPTDPGQGGEDGGEGTDQTESAKKSLRF